MGQFGFHTNQLKFKLCPWIAFVAPEYRRLQFKISAPYFCRTCDYYIIKMFPGTYLPALFVPQSSFTQVERIHFQSSLPPQRHGFDAWCPSFLETFCHAHCLQFVVTHACTNILWNLRCPRPDEPNKIRNNIYNE